MLLVGMLAVSAIGADTELTRVLKAVENRYNNASTLQVLFREEYTPSGRPHRTDAGMLTLSRPGRMRWEYSQPKGNLWISDGKQVFNYSLAENRVKRQPLKESEDFQAPLAFLLGKLHFDKEFRNLQSHPEGSGGIRIVAEPKVDTLPYSQVEFLVSAENHILEVKVIGFDKSILVYNFDQEKMNIPVDPKLFQFRIPPGAEVVEVGQ